MNRQLFAHINIDQDNTYVPDGHAPARQELARFRKQLYGPEREAPQRSCGSGRVDLQLLGTGTSGHIGFNEAGDYLIADAHIENLAESTIEANSRYFRSREQVPRQAFTQGVGDILKARSIVLIASGPAKVQAITQLLTNNRISTQCPVTLLKLHPDATVVLERDLARAAGYQDC
ncbi:glucosamine-6-phosphate deaminase-like [Saccostrea echinata]|uniref:glucosamine-6-phosphate deaminase-like n=1 Tax=Saccostrea echinata TaxID=191078 RepID=UPI002A828EB3|nr:glucosamine-6-phosphate deaminase-like [Saccostrea echinata]